jgi:hypothetical protein
LGKSRWYQHRLRSEAVGGGEAVGCRGAVWERADEGLERAGIREGDGLVACRITEERIIG